MTLNELLTYFKITKRHSNNSYQCTCPVHNDSKASLTVSEDRGKLLLRCHAGCDTKDILEEVGLSFKDIGSYKPQQWKERLEYGQKKQIEAIYDYRTAEGKYLYSKVRFEGKEIRYLTIDKKNDTYQYCKKRVSVLYNLPEVVKAVKDGYPVYIVEGEKDADTLKKLGYTVTTAGGVNDWKKEFAAYFTGVKVVILPDNDGPGLKLKDQIVRDLKHYAHSVRWAVTSEADKGDVTDYLTKEGHTKEDLKQLVADAENIGAPWLYYSGKEPNRTLKVNGDILADSISRGLSYLIVRRPEEDKDDFYVYENGVYNKCNRNKVKSIIRKYVPVGLASDNMINNVYNLLLCKESNICTFRDLDTNEQYINVRNGLYNIRNKQLEPHTPKLYSTVQLDCEYQPENNHRPVFERYMNDLCSDTDGNIDKEKKAVLQEYIGLILSNVKVYRTKLCLVLYSLLGNSGKTQILNMVDVLLGSDKTINIPLQQMNENSKFSMGSIVGKRLISIGDQTGSDINDSAVFKQLTGGDPVKVEPKNKQPFSYTFCGGIIMACNNLPNIKDDKGGHVFERFCIVPCTNTIEQERRDGELLDKMLKERNAIFNWFLTGLNRLIDNGYKVTKSKACDEAANEYRNTLDTIFRYLDEYYIITDDKMDMILKTKFEDDYTYWCKDNGYMPINKRGIKDRMEKNGVRLGKDSRGNRMYRNIKVKEEELHFLTEEEYKQEKIPFK